MNPRGVSGWSQNRGREFDPHHSALYLTTFTILDGLFLLMHALFNRLFSFRLHLRSFFPHIWTHIYIYISL